MIWPNTRHLTAAPM